MQRDARRRRVRVRDPGPENTSQNDDAKSSDYDRQHDSDRTVPEQQPGTHTALIRSARGCGRAKAHSGHTMRRVRALRGRICSRPDVGCERGKRERSQPARSDRADACSSVRLRSWRATRWWVQLRCSWVSAPPSLVIQSQTNTDERVCPVAVLHLALR